MSSDSNAPRVPDFQAPPEPTLWTTLFTWLARLLIVAGALAIGWVWAKNPGGIQVGWALQYGLFIAVSIVASFCYWLLAANVVVAGAWLALSWPEPPEPKSEKPRWPASDLETWLHVTTWVNRQVGHVEALAAWIAVALVWDPRLTVQLPFLAAVVLFGGPIINAVARTRYFGGARAAKSQAALLMDRRSLIYFSACLGLLVLALYARHQWAAFAPLFLTVLPGLGLRYFRFRRRKRQEGKGSAGGNSEERGLVPVETQKGDRPAESDIRQRRLALA
jgi:hypothetical protein